MNKPNPVPVPAPSPSPAASQSAPSVLDVTTPRHADAALGHSALVSAGVGGNGGGGGGGSSSGFALAGTSNDALLGGTEEEEVFMNEKKPLNEVENRDGNVHGKDIVLEIRDRTPLPKTPWWKTLAKFIGPGSMIAVGYMDPGNWATDLSGGSQFYYNLLFCILLSNIFAVLLQSLAIKAGLVTGRDLAQLCRHHFHPYVNAILYITAEAAIIATDLAEVIGASIALNLLFSIPLPWGVAITGLDVLIILLGFTPKHLRYFEFFIMSLIASIGICFIALLIKVKPIWGDVFAGYLPRGELFSDPKQLFIFMGIVGATVMPHNLYLHTHLVLYRYQPTTTFGPAGTIHAITEIPRIASRRPHQHIELLPRTIWYSFIDCIMSLTYALFVNSSILIVAAAVFFAQKTEVATIEDAYRLLGSELGAAAGTLFAVALLCSGQSSTITGTIAGQVVMGGFLGPRWRMKPWLRRLVSRLLAIVPAMITVVIKGQKGLDDLLVISQVILSMQLPFAVWPLIYFTSKKTIMTVKYAAESYSSEDKEPLVEEIPIHTTSRSSEVSVSSASTQGDSTTKTYENAIYTTIAAVLVATVITGLNVVMLLQIMAPGLFPSHD
ncbi:hypothetical protein SpCBS45565_g04609 [Spizellomyces sp. 'palustris']|nr:hypothetical protein SpCBS45565_g04609 [Spizellomyces sp. 'palustris']